MKIQFDCPICDVEDWGYFDTYRDQKYWYDRDFLVKNEPVGFKICKNCSFVTYDYIGLDRLKERYDRARITFDPSTIITCNRKNLYHELFFSDFFKGQDISHYMVLDVGAAQGAMLDWFGKEYNIPRENLYGTEFSKAFMTFGKHEYGLNMYQDLCDDITSRQYDLISYYHVLEHVQWPYDELVKIKKLLKPGGYLYISIPTWFNWLQESSLEPVSTMEYYYHLNHVNVFTNNSFMNLLKKANLKVLKVDQVIYGYTVMCQVDESIKLDKIEVDDIDDIKRQFEAQTKALSLFKEKKYEDALKVYPRFPEAYIALSINQKNLKAFESQKEWIEKGLQEMPDNVTLKEQLANIHFQFDENRPNKQKFYSNNIRRSEELLLECVKLKPNDKNYFFLGLINGVYKKDYEEAVKCMKKVIDINPTNLVEPMRWIGLFYKEMG